MVNKLKEFIKAQDKAGSEGGTKGSEEGGVDVSNVMITDMSVLMDVMDATCVVNDDNLLCIMYNNV